MEHESVLLPETIDLLAVKPEGIYVDATLGRGGHTRALAERLTTGRLYSFDKDAEAIAESQENLADLADRMEAHGILLRRCDNYCGLGPGWFRTAVRTHAENERLLRTMEIVLMR